MKNHPYLSYFRRGSSDIQCSAESVKAMLRDSSLEPYDNKILPKYTINDLDYTTIEQYRNKFNELHPEHPFTKLINIDFLEKIQAVRINRETGEVNVTVAGLLVFGKHTSIKEEIPHYNIEYINKSGMDSNLYYKDRLIYDGTWGEDNIYNFFNKAIEKLYMSIHETSDIGEDSITRRSSSLLKVAIREALVNSLVHCDYLAHEGILVIRYSDRFIFKNGGTLRIPTHDFFAGGYSDPRNNIIQEIFRHIGLCERAGSGIPKIMTAVEKNKYKYPQISVDQSSFELILWDNSIISSENITDEKEIEIVKLAISNYVITISDVTKLLSIHRNTASKYLNKLVEKEIFVKVKSGNENKYSIASDEKFDKYNFVNLLKTMSEELKRN